MVVTEALVGLAMGAIASLPMLSLEMSGVMMGQSMGLGLARVYNPDSDIDADVTGQFLYYIGAGIFIAMGGLEQLMGGVIESFARVPLGGFEVGKAPLDLLTGTLTSGFDLAIRVAAPVTGIVLLLVIVIGVMGKTMPQINVMSVGFAVKIIAGLAMLTLALYAVGNAVGDDVAATLTNVLRWVRGL
jgi:flagellar biosynthesis protein FliR